MSSKPDTAGFSFREKSLVVTVVANVAVYAYYFWRAFSIGEDNPELVAALFMRTVVLLVLVMVASHSVLAVVHRPERVDERDRVIAMRGTHIGYYVLASGAFCALVVAATGRTFWTAHAILAALVLAEIAKDASRLVYYRRGA
ncbi:MAG TPA: hypothetical protein VGG74_35105 [Kofleriaceae bacterium]